MSETPNGGNGAAPQQQSIQLTGNQLAAMLVIEGLVAQMTTAANQVGGFVGYKYAGDIILAAQKKLMRDYDEMRQQWGRTVQLASPAALSVIEGKKAG